MSLLNVLALAERIPDEAAAYEYLEGLRLPDGPECPHCGNGNRCYYLTPKDEAGRKTRTGNRTQRRLWKCGACRKQFSVLTGAVMHGTKIPVRTWVFVMFEMAASKNGVSAREIERKYGVTNRSAWFLTHRIREAMAHGGITVKMTGTVMADETWIGGKPKNRHGYRWNKGTQGVTDKMPVVSLINKETGEVRSRIVPNVNGQNLRAVIAANADLPNTTLHTDEWLGYKQVGREVAAHERITHREGEYARGAVTTNHVEGFFSQLKRSIDGTHHHVSVTHLDRYLAEFDYRYSTRAASDGDRMADLIRRSGGRRLTYDDLVGRDGDTYRELAG